MDSAVTSPPAPLLQERGVGELLMFCVYGGEHPFPWVDGWLMQFKFANGLIASVIQYRAENVMEVGVRDDHWLYEVAENLNGEQVREKLFEVMGRKANYV